MNNTNTLPRMRTAHNAFLELKERDPRTAFSERAIRRLILTKEIPSVRVGKKYLINMERLYDYLYKGSLNEEETFSGIRAVAE